MAAAERRSASRGPGILATLAGALLLVVLGFGVGLVAGAAFEEPELVLDHLAGRTTEVALPPAPAAEASPAAAEHALVKTRSSASPAQQEAVGPPAVSAPPPAGGFAVQVGAFATEEPARELAGQLTQAGHTSYVTSAEGAGARFKVRVGPLASREDAMRVAQRLAAEQGLPTWVLARGPE